MLVAVLQGMQSMFFFYLEKKSKFNNLIYAMKSLNQPEGLQATSHQSVRTYVLSNAVF